MKMWMNEYKYIGSEKECNQGQLTEDIENFEGK